MRRALGMVIIIDVEIVSLLVVVEKVPARLPVVGFGMFLLRPANLRSAWFGNTRRCRRGSLSGRGDDCHRTTGWLNTSGDGPTGSGTSGGGWSASSDRVSGGACRGGRRTSGDRISRRACRGGRCAGERFQTGQYLSFFPERDRHLVPDSISWRPNLVVKDGITPSLTRPLLVVG